ncbi:MAG TPA: GGDEF domain-containing protein, partial [Lysobacter sp.]|nr:GGDEF domain-containing protein [Lysobacter sp.]
MPRRLLPALATAAMLAIASFAHAQPSATGFDRLFQHIDDGEVPVSAEAQSMEAIARLRAALPPGDERRARRFRSVVCALDFRHDIHGELAYAQRGIEDARRARDVDAEARFEFCRGYALETLRPNEALDAYGRALVLARRTEDARLIGDAYVLRGGIHSLLGDQAQALGDLLAAQAVFDRARLARRAEGNLLDIGTVYRRMGVYAQAMDYLRQSAAHARRTGSDPALFGSLMQQGYALEEQHQGPAAVRTFEEALAVAARTDRLDRGYAHLGLGNAWRV